MIVNIFVFKRVSVCLNFHVVSFKLPTVLRSVATFRKDALSITRATGSLMYVRQHLTLIGWRDIHWFHNFL